MTGGELADESVALRPICPEDVEVLRAIHVSPSVRQWWGDPGAEWPGGERHVVERAVWHQDQLVGYVQWEESDDPMYRHATIDLFLDESAQGRGLGRQVVGLVSKHLIDDLGHHRIVIYPAAANERAIACYAACGFRPVGVVRRYERDVDGTGWHDGLLMELVIDR
jgi:RimJ/RimL family protein N-acetyltransferase